MDPRDNKHIRIDKWLWAVRIFKTRTMAANACKKSKVTVNGTNVKPSYPIKIGQTVEVKNFAITRTFKVTGVLEKRVSAKLAVNFVEETTPPETFEKLKAMKNDIFALRPKGTGRPTKRDRRKIQRWTGGTGE